MPLVGALRQSFPSAFIAWVTQDGPADLLRDYPGLDQVLLVPRKWMKSWTQIRKIRRQLQSLRFDVTLDPQSLTKSSALGWLSGARRRIGFASPQGRELSGWLNTERVVPRRDHVVEKYIELIRPLGIDPPPKPRFELPIRAHHALARFLHETCLVNDYAVINPGAGWDSKLWVPSRFGQVARYLGETHQLPSIVAWAGHRELIWAKEIVARSGGHAWLAPTTNLSELAELLCRAKLCVASDTGPLHLAAAVGTPCVGLYGPTRPRVCGPYGAANISVQAYYQAGTSRQRRGAANEAMRAIEVPLVLDACHRVLASERTSHAA